MPDPWRLSDATARPWAKSDPPYALWRHLLDVAAVARALLAIFPVGGALPDALVAALIGLHDIGKADPLFQLKAPSLAEDLGTDATGALRTGWSREVASFRHEARSAEALRELLTAAPFGWPKRDAQSICRAIRGHHGNFQSETLDEGQYPPSVTAHWRQVRRELCEMVLRVLGAAPSPPPQDEQLDVFGVRLSAVLVAADWIASNPALLQTQATSDDPREHFARATDGATRALTALGLLPVVPAQPTAASWSQLFGDGFSPRGVQQVVCDREHAIAPGLVLIEASTGEGKTESALYLAEQWRAALGTAGVYLALPTQATSNDLHRRYTAFLERNAHGASPLLVHGMAWLMDRDAPAGQLDPGASADAVAQQREADAWIRNARRALLAPHAVGTIDQVLLAALSVRFGFLRLLGLGQKVLIVDEVHACDTYMQERLGRVLRWCRAQRTPVILLSATLARRQREALVRAWYGDEFEVAFPSTNAYPLVTIAPFDASPAAPIGVEARALPDAAPRPTPRTLGIELSSSDGDLGTLTPTMCQRLTGPAPATGCAAVILNTVKGAQQAFRQLRASLPDDRPSLLFHSRFPAWRRLEIEREVRRLFGKDAQLGGDRPRAALVVATQVLEQSLDVDFDTMVSEVAPIDALLQRAGRLHRHERARSTDAAPRLSVLLPIVPEEADDDRRRISRVYDDLVVLRTMAALAERTEVTLPSDYRTLIESVYSEPCSLDAHIAPSRLEKAVEESHKSRERQLQLAQHHLIGAPVADRFAYPNTAAPFAVAEAEEHEEGNNLRAQTRDGEYTTAILAITRDVERDALARYERGSRDLRTRRTLMEARVPIPRWWLRETRGLADVEYHACLLFDADGVCEQEPRLRFTPLEGVWFDDGK